MTLVTLEVSNNVSERMLLHFYVNLATLIHKGDKAYY